MSYRSPSNPRTSSFQPDVPLHHVNPANPPYSPISHINAHTLDDSASFFSHAKHSRTKTSDNVGKIDPHNSSSLELREKKLEEQFQTLLERCNRSKESLQTMQKVAFGDKETQRPYNTHQSMHLKSPTYSNISTTTKTLQDYEHENKYFPKTEKNIRNVAASAHIYSMNDEEQLQNEVADLKKQILDRVKNREIESSKGKIKFKDQIEGISDDENSKANRDNWQRKEVSYSREGKLQNRVLEQTDKLNKRSLRSKRDEEDRSQYIKEVKEEKTRAERSLGKLKDTIKEKERIQQEKYQSLKEKCKELKSILRDYVNRVMDLEGSLKRKDEQIVEYEEQVRKGEEELMRSDEVIDDLKRKEEFLRRNETEAKNANMEFKLKLNQQKEKIEEIELASKEAVEKYKEELQEIFEENDKLKVELSILKENEANLNKKNENLEKEADTLKSQVDTNKEAIRHLETTTQRKDEDLKDLRMQVEKLRSENGILEGKIKEMREIYKQSSEKADLEQRKFEEDIEKIKEEKERDIFKKKEKLKVLKQQIKDVQTQAQKAIEEKNLIHLEIERILGQKNAVERDLTKSREEVKFMKEEM